MKRDLFKQMLSKLIADEKGEYPLDLRAGKKPYSHKDNDVFLIDDLDGVYDYVEGSEEWFVDIYSNTNDGRFPHADYTGSTLTSSALNKAMEEEWQRTPKRAYEKFEKRLDEVGLLDEWYDAGGCGRVATTTDDGISIFVHEGDDDAYTEFKFPPIKEMEKSEYFRMKALQEFCQHPDDEFVAQLARWAINYDNVCPLYPVDVYLLWSNPTIIDFEDDKVEEKIEDVLAHYEKVDEWCQHCDNEVELAHELRVQKCPSCGKWIVPCAMCPLTDCLPKCPLERMASILNNE